MGYYILARFGYDAPKWDSILLFKTKLLSIQQKLLQCANDNIKSDNFWFIENFLNTDWLFISMIRWKMLFFSGIKLSTCWFSGKVAIQNCNCCSKQIHLSTFLLNSKIKIFFCTENDISLLSYHTPNGYYDITCKRLFWIF